jgi:acylphosphatase
MSKTLLIKISGSRVWGVGFRFESHLQMVDLGLTGKAENTKEGVEIEVSGEDEALEKFVNWAKQGPEGARVGNVEVIEMNKNDLVSQKGYGGQVKNDENEKNNPE